MARTPYLFLRSTELSGRHPHDVGEWLTFPMRVKFGEGTPATLVEDRFRNISWNPSDYVDHSTHGTYPPAPKLDRSELQPYRVDVYRRIRSLVDAQFHMYTYPVPWIQTCIHIFPNWANPKDGIIQHPAEGQSPLPDPHCVPLSWMDGRFFGFENSWGENWGKDGNGQFDFEYFDRYCFESWACYSKQSFEEKRAILLGKVVLHRWIFQDELRQKIHGFHLTDRENDDRLAWLFAIEKGNYLEIEEFFVMPDHRRKGYGKILVDSLKGFARSKPFQIKIWVPFSETQQEAPSNYPALLKIVEMLEVKFQKCPVKWAAYYGATDIEGSTIPVEPDYIPIRPKSMRAVVLAALLLGLLPSISDPTTETIRAALSQNNISDDDLDEFNHIRFAMIKKENRDGLSDSEKRMLDSMQEASQKLLPKNYYDSPLIQEVIDLMREFRGQAK